MSKLKLTTEEKAIELKRLRDVIIFSADYFFKLMSGLSNNQFDPKAYCQSIKTETEKLYEEKKLTMLRRWHANMIEPFRVEKNLDFEFAMKKKTGFDMGIAEWYQRKFDRIIENKKMKSIEDYGWSKTFLRFENHHLYLNKKKLSLLKAFAEEYEAKLRKRNLQK